MESFDQIFDTLPEFSVCDAVSGAIEDCYGYEHLMTWPEDVPVECRVVHYIWSTTGFLECEGYARFFNLQCEHGAYPTAMDAIGVADVAQSIRDALSLVPAACLGDTDCIIAHFGSWEALCEAIESHEKLLYQSSSRIEAALANYVRTHKDVFRPLLPHLCTQNHWRAPS
jgi:hypothetical protein